ncbi:MAG: aminotransferase class I/II-fold pyridoxal phosphate-dependent enzyme [Flavobacteriales bacterium]|jgi:glycine C-acetyltransferase|nr:aminotransferase class I/II-fold pyridoxal phosphate-dependent enzyme [Flavobacteriales bacterium]MBT3962586.1 aminotransferase class I/II-fold pyridoxal phosphate-dependent enzyme [Flavobacteriales bacterium]MBT4705193.1 aminotransferase class I/II-fold pyridoxal phosphate-dependent enzyme [Flavobacteriales bacterium]MBT4930391.1 aminotransferase class I/II-fold pyridoxal phosphate-dependent enzyme [Flavobacteriales bacterium]MBT5132614.1 aminotransferase class I/II-fold pyridoxal phosphate
MRDIFEKIRENKGPLGQYSQVGHGYFFFPKLEGPIGNKMKFRGKDALTWSLNNYLGLANHPEVREADAKAAEEWGLAYPMGARMMSGNSNQHEELEAELTSFVNKEDTILLNYGYQGMSSSIDALVDRNDVIVYDSESHACIMDGMRMHIGKRFVYKHNDMESLRAQLARATKLVADTTGGILVITEGVFGMAGDQGLLKEIVDLKSDFDFRLFVDDAHGIGTLGPTGAGTGEEQGCMDGIDVYFGTFAKSFSLIGGFISSEEKVIEYLRYNTRSQIFAKSLPMPLVIGALKRLELMRTQPEHKENLWKIVNLLQGKLRENGFNLGRTNSCVTPVFLNGGPFEAANVILDLRENHGIFCSMVVYPVVPKDTIMLRLIPTAVHTEEDVNYTIEIFTQIKKKLEDGFYAKDKIVYE